MKTAMQLAFERIELMERIDKDSTHWQMFKEHYLEKEKEQIMKANIEGTEHGYREIHVFGIDARPYSKNRAEHYYNETYQNN